MSSYRSNDNQRENWELVDSNIPKNDITIEDTSMSMLNENTMYTFDEHMWDKLPEIQQHSQQGTKLLQEFSLFSKGYNKALKNFGNEVKKVLDTFTTNMQKYESINSKKGSSIIDHSYFGYRKGLMKSQEKAR